MKYIKSLLLGLVLTGVLVTAFAQTDKVSLAVSPSCPACHQAEQELNQAHIKYTTYNSYGLVPRIYVNGEYRGTGVEAVEAYINSHRG